MDWEIFLEGDDTLWLLANYGVIAIVAFIWGRHSAGQSTGIDTTGRVMGSIGGIALIWLFTQPFGEMAFLGGLFIPAIAWGAGTKFGNRHHESEVTPVLLTAAERAQAERIDAAVASLTTHGVATGLTLTDAELLQGLAARQGVQTVITRTAADHYSGAEHAYKVRRAEVEVVRRDELM